VEDTVSQAAFIKISRHTQKRTYQNNAELEEDKG
jgi:hypothetical protein